MVPATRVQLMLSALLCSNGIKKVARQRYTALKGVRLNPEPSHLVVPTQPITRRVLCRPSPGVHTSTYRHKRVCACLDA